MNRQPMPAPGGFVHKAIPAKRPALESRRPDGPPIPFLEVPSAQPLRPKAVKFLPERTIRP